MPIPQRFAIPTNDDDFEQMCLELLRRHWSRPGLEIFGKRGERQFGIDILDVSGETPVYAAQCKLKEPHKSLPPADIQTEVDEANKFRPPLGKYSILTTGKVSTQSQRRVREINQAHKTAGLFEVEVLTWERLCLLLQQYHDVQEQFYGEVGIERAQRIEAHLVTIKDGVHSLTSRSVGGEIDSLINDARDCITRREFQLATLLLNLIQHKGDQLTPRQTFRVLSNHGAAALGLGKPDVAAKFFLEAASSQPDDEQGKTNEVLAYLLVGDLKTCHAKATVLRRQYPASARLAAMWVTTAPMEVSLHELECADISSIIRSDAEVSLAFARRALAECDFEKSRIHADASRTAAPNWAQPHLVLAEINVGRALHLESGCRPLRAGQLALLRDGEVACSRALDLARTGNDQNSEVAALVHRVDVRLLLTDNDSAAKDAEDAHRLSSDDPNVLLAMAQVCLAAGQVDEGISCLSRAHNLHARADIAFIYGKALADRGREGDLDNALKVLLQISLSAFRPKIRPSVVTQVIQCFAKKKAWSEAILYVDQVSEFLDPVVVTLIRGYLAHYQASKQEADSFAVEALSRLASDADPETKEFLARLLMLTGRPADALPLWQDLFELDAPGFDPGNLLDCAAGLHRDDVVLQACECLHARGVNDWHLLEFELPYLQKYDIDAAIDRLQTFVNDNPGNKLSRLRLSQLGLLLSKPELVQAKQEDLPAVSDLPLDYAMLAVQVIKVGGDATAAVDYAYRFLRNNFGEIEAHKALLMAMMPGPSSLNIPPVLKVVGPDAAVCYQEIPSGEPKWVVLEDTDNPSGDFEEIAITSFLAKQLIGKRVGDAVVIARGQLQDRMATVLHILPKYVRRYQDSMGEMQVRFGAASSVESVRVSVPGEAGGQNGLEVVLASVKQRADAVVGIREVYRSAPISLHLYGAQFGENAYVSIVDLALSQGQQVKCSQGSVEERNQALLSLQTAKAVVVDITALATLRILGLTKVLSSTKYKFIVSQRTRITLREMLAKSRMFSAPGGTLSYEGGRHLMYEQTAEGIEQGIREDEEFVRFIETVTEIRSGVPLAAQQPSKRDLLEKVFGQYGAESIVLASDPDQVLWTDDLIQAQLSAQEFGVRRVWTQLVLGTLADAGLISPDEYSEASARLIGMEFVATLFDASALLAGFKLAGWSPQQRPAAQFVKVFSDPHANVQQIFGIFVAFIEKLYREALSPGNRCAITRSLLDALGGRSAAMASLESLRRLSSRVFGINAVGEKQFNDCFDLWLKHKDDQLILPA